MHSILKILLAIVIFGVLIFIHEFGHFMIAKLCGIKVNKFALGMGPCIFRKRKGETEYSVRILPIGGFCSMEGEDEESNNEGAFGSKPVWKRILVVAAGAFMNILLGFILVVVTTCMLTRIPVMKISGFDTTGENEGKIVASSYETGLSVLSLIHISEPTRPSEISYAVFCLKKIFLMIRRPPRSTL